MQIDNQTKQDFYILAVICFLLGLALYVIINADKISEIINPR